ncbi:MAG: DHH family phosphoesterase [Armatimonadetes bacterium]|nr:DHH family phosphoesterase [Armatimonadota bacterium]
MSLNKDNLNATVRLIETGQKFIIAAHARPDPDSMGSALALARGIRQKGKSTVVISQDGVPSSCQYLPDTKTVVMKTAKRGFDVGIVCDADGVRRTGSAAEAVVSAKSLLIIDHHISSAEQVEAEDAPARADLEAVGQQSRSSEPLYLADKTAAATAEVVFDLLNELRVSIDLEMARQLMAGIVGDTGVFKFTNVTPRTLEIAARLTALGASPSEAAEEIYENRSMVNLKLLGVALLAAQPEKEGKIVWSRITREDFERFGARDSDTESIVNQLRATKSAQVGILFREVAENRVRVSLRSRDGFDVNRIAAAFGGGGHAAAAGCTVEKSLEEAEKAVLSEVSSWMES